MSSYERGRHTRDIYIYICIYIRTPPWLSGIPPSTELAQPNSPALLSEPEPLLLGLRTPGLRSGRGGDVREAARSNDDILGDGGA